jgi:hypothetical protein
MTMKAAILGGVFALLLMIGLLLFLRPADSIEYHRRGWLESLQQLQGGKPGPTFMAMFRRELARLLHGDRDPHQLMREHERALLRLGYLAERELHLTNQVITRAFRSNFFVRVRQAFGTNESIWMYHALTNNGGLRLTVPAKDVGRWETIFRECAAGYASNVPPASTP